MAAAGEAAAQCGRYKLFLLTTVLGIACGADYLNCQPALVGPEANCPREASFEAASRVAAHAARGACHGISIERHSFTIALGSPGSPRWAANCGHAALAEPDSRRLSVLATKTPACLSCAAHPGRSRRTRFCCPGLAALPGPFLRPQGRGIGTLQCPEHPGRVSSWVQPPWRSFGPRGAPGRQDTHVAAHTCAAAGTGARVPQRDG